MTRNGPDKAEVDARAHGKWGDIFRRLAPELIEALDAGPGRHVRCPLPGHDDGDPSFNLDKPDEGRAICTCGSRDGYGLLMEIRGWDFPRALQEVAAAAGVNGKAKSNGKPKLENIVEHVCREKSVPIESCRAFGGHAAKRGKLPVCRFPVYNQLGEAHSHFDLPAGGGKGWLDSGEGKSGVMLPHDADGKPIFPKAGETWLRVEGVKDASALRSLGFNVVGIPSSKLSKKFARLFQGVHVVAVPDRDKAGIEGAEHDALLLAGVAASYAIATLPAEYRETGGADVRDCLRLPNGEGLVRQAIADAQPWKPAAAALPNRTIIVGTDEPRVVDEAIEALASCDGVYQRGGKIVHIVHNAAPPRGITRPVDAPRIVLLEPAGIRERLASAALWAKPGAGDKLERCHPPAWAVSGVEARGQWKGIPPIEGVVEAPVMLADGSILQRPGYDASSGLFLDLRCEFPAVADKPTRHDATDAAEIVLETVADFPFEKPAHKAAWLAAALTPPAWFAFDAGAPLIAADANVPGSGKGLMINAIAHLHTGRAMPLCSAPKDDEEVRKRITAVALAGEMMLLFDNVARAIEFPSLDAALTGTVWTDRLLGKSESTGAMPLVTTWFVTGNNLVFGADTSRRTLHIRLESSHENPEEREDFRHPDLLGWIRAQRPRLIAAALTVLRAYHVAGRPRADIPAWGSFEGWSNLVRQAVVWCGLPDPASTREQVRQDSDRNANTLRALLAGWDEVDPTRAGLTVSAAIKYADQHPDDCPTFLAAIADMTPVGKQPNARSIGMKLNHLRRRISGGLRFDHRTECNTRVWFVEDCRAVGD